MSGRIRQILAAGAEAVALTVLAAGFMLLVWALVGVLS